MAIPILYQYAKGEVGMNINGSMAKKCCLTASAVLTMVLFLTVAIPVQRAYAEDESITVSCYKGNGDEGNYVGQITVNHIRDAVADCNQTYEGCQGSCLGCVVDAENFQVCYDSDGQKVAQ
jgi:hypothetical protein